MQKSTILVLAMVTLLSACATTQPATGINDPYERVNREIHESNVRIDRKVLRPASLDYGNNVPDPMRRGISNFASNLALPGIVVNDVLQFKLADALQNTSRFLINSTVGLGGILDPGTRIGLEERGTDFGETLYVWGVGEGPYLELPSLGPSTTRDAVGKGVDMIINPVRYLVGWPEVLSVSAAGALKLIDTRFRLGSTVDSILYESADSYAQSRLLYLENRRFQLSGGAQASNVELYDIYEETYE